MELVGGTVGARCRHEVDMIDGTGLSGQVGMARWLLEHVYIVGPNGGLGRFTVGATVSQVLLGEMSLTKWEMQRRKVLSII